METTTLMFCAIQVIQYIYPLFCAFVLLNFVLSILIDGYSRLKPVFTALQQDEKLLRRNVPVRQRPKSLVGPIARVPSLQPVPVVLHYC
jgi:hypothetical protein